MRVRSAFCNSPGDTWAIRWNGLQSGAKRIPSGFFNSRGIGIHQTFSWTKPDTLFDSYRTAHRSRAIC